MEEYVRDCKICFHCEDRNVLKKKKKKKVSLQLHQLLFLQMKRFIWESFSCEKQLSSTNFPFCEVSQVQMSLECDYLNIAMLLKLIILLDFRIQPL